MTIKNKYKVDLQIVPKCPDIPNRFLIQRWVNETLKKYLANAEVCIRVVDTGEIQQLNAQYRKQNKPTNVLSFPCVLPDAVALDKSFIGDIIICAEVIAQQAQAQNKTVESHWAHMVIHGLLHLMGLDHQTEAEAVLMESKEIEILHDLGYPNPYLDEVIYER